MLYGTMHHLRALQMASRLKSEVYTKTEIYIQEV